MQVALGEVLTIFLLVHELCVLGYWFTNKDVPTSIEKQISFPFG